MDVRATIVFVRAAGTATIAAPSAGNSSLFFRDIITSSWQAQQIASKRMSKNGRRLV